jgi:hypothetical protein
MGNTLLKMVSFGFHDGMLGSDAVEEKQNYGPTCPPDRKNTKRGKIAALAELYGVARKTVYKWLAAPG